MPYQNHPSNKLRVPDEFVSDGTYARYVNVKGEWHMSLAPQMAAIVQIGTAVTCDVETKSGKRYPRSGTVVRTGTAPDGTKRALATIEAFRAGRANDERNTFAMLPDGTWGVRLHVAASRRARRGDTVDVAVTARSGRVAHVTARVTDIVENEFGDRQAVAAIVRRDDGRHRPDDDARNAGEPCPACGSTACDSDATGRCALSPEHHPEEFGDIPLADTPREDLGTNIEPIALAQDWDHWAARISRGEPVRIFDETRP
ncbi:MAG: hypothetical protein OXH75_25505 [Acidobacteria bacterium]|nr:hypothetical protein [Acidobacteriota bacterium]